jgi:hypothetical protein
VSQVRAALLIRTSNKKQLNWSRANSRHVDRGVDDTSRSLSSSHADIWSSRTSSPSPFYLHLSSDFIQAKLHSWTRTYSKRFYQRPPVVLSFLFFVSFDFKREVLTCETHSFFVQITLLWSDLIHSSSRDLGFRC